MNMQPGADSLIKMERPPPRRARRPRGLWPVVALLVAAAVVLAVRYEYPHRVESVAVAPSAFAVELSGPGTLDALNRIAVGARTQGRLADVYADVGDTVRSDDVLARLEAEEISGQRAAAGASAVAARQAVEMAQSSRDAARAALDAAQATLDRQTVLTRDGIASQQALVDARSAFDQAQADFARADQAVGQARAQAQGAAANVDVIDAQLAEMTVRAPVSGVVISRDGNPGDVVGAGEAILELVDPDSIVLTARFDESAIAAIRPGLRVAVSFASQPQTALRGHVLRLGRMVDTETREFTVDIRLDALPVNWAIGQRGIATVELQRLDGVLAVPQSFVTRRDGRAGLWVAAGGRARWRPVSLGAESGEAVQVTAGIDAGDVVLAPDGLFAFMRVALSDGQP